MKYRLPVIFVIFASLVITVVIGVRNSLYNRITAQESVKLGTFDVPTATTEPTAPIEPTSPIITGSPTDPVIPTAPVVTGPPGASPTYGLKRGGAVAKTDPYYCIDDEDPDGCDDQTAFHVPKGTGGISGTCGTIIQWGHTLVNSLPDPQAFMKATRNSLNPAVSSPGCNYTTGPYSAPDYISTYFVIDAFNLAGYHELSKTNPSHVSGTGLLAWWNSPEAQTAGYTYVPYSPNAIQNHAQGTKDLTGCVAFFNVASGVHVGLVNVLELVNGNGDGVFSIIHAGVRFILDRFEVVGWDVKNTLHQQVNTNGLAGFGCHN